MEVSNRGRNLKDAFIKSKGYWVEEFEGLAMFSPDFLEAHLAAGVLVAKAGVIPTLLSELIAIAIDVSATHLYEPGLRLHIKNALKVGATKEQIGAVIQIVSTLGVQSLLVGLPLLLTVVKGTPADISDRLGPLSENQQMLKRKYVDLAHVWSDAHTQLLLLAPDYFEANLALASVALGTDLLTEKEKNLILVAVNGSVTHLQEEGLRLAMEAALAAGASPDEIIHVLRRVSPMGIHAAMLGYPILLDEVEKTQPFGE